MICPPGKSMSFYKKETEKNELVARPVMSQFVGKSAPFIILAFLALFDGGLQLLVLQPQVSKKEEEAPSLKTLISDPYILVAAGTV